MKTHSILFSLLTLIIFSTITFMAESTLFAVLAYFALVILLVEIKEKLINKLDL